MRTLAKYCVYAKTADQKRLLTALALHWKEEVMEYSSVGD